MVLLYNKTIWYNKINFKCYINQEHLSFSILRNVLAVKKLHLEKFLKHLELNI